MSDTQDSAVVKVDPKEPAWRLLRDLQRCRAVSLLAWQDSPDRGDIVVRQASGQEVSCARWWLKRTTDDAQKTERHRIALLLIRHIDALDCAGKDKKASKILHAVLDEIKGDEA